MRVTANLESEESYLPGSQISVFSYAHMVKSSEKWSKFSYKGTNIKKAPSLRSTWVLSHFSSVQFSSVTQSYPTRCDPMNLSMPGLPVHHHLPEFTQTHVHQVSDTIQPSYPLSFPSPPAFNLSQHQALFQWVSSNFVINLKEKVYLKKVYRQNSPSAMTHTLFVECVSL